ncbi:hypothetical protein [Cryobacterium sp.]|jgi:hypothetical protein|uniref:hypothetical protein n=1 Tax=Cryobacterium sp. TaxID=1926290 RepID=UPI00261F4D77|nr:hypothetical protein [Cryobacterium sp.]MCU1446277.1 hypothetical protein [Cryobacterium sp.]
MIRTVALTFIAVLALTGCSSAVAPDPPASPTSATSATASPTPTATAAPASTATASPTPSATTSETPVTAPGCDTVLTDDEYASLAADGLVLAPDVRVLDDVMQTLMDEGFGCQWAGGGDVSVWYAQADHDEATWAARRQELLDAGWTETDTPTEGVLAAPADHDPNYVPVVVHRNGVTYYASYDRFLGSVTALLG